MSLLATEAILRTEPLDAVPGEVIGSSREGRPIHGYRFGSGASAISLIAGCHADEPVGPLLLGHLTAWLSGLDSRTPALRDYAWHLVPHVNPDGAECNRSWSEVTTACVDHLGEADRGYDLGSYLRSVVRELPGDDIEFGFPRAPEDREARVENRAVANFLRPHGPYVLHASLHGMDIAPGPWFLMEESWSDRTSEMRDALRGRVREMGYALFDPDRGGEKGFRRIDAGFTSRPDSTAMTEHFLRLGDQETAGRFRPNSMEFVRALGGDPLTLVSEMPLFLALPDQDRDLRARAREQGLRKAVESALAEGLRPMPIRDQMRLQLAFLDAALEVIERSENPV